MTLSAARLRPLQLLLAALCAAAAFAAATSTARADTAPVVQSATSWMSNSAPVGWSTSLNRVIYNSEGSDGMWDAYSSNPDGSDPQCLTCASPVLPGAGANTNRGATDVSPDGQWMLVEIETGNHSGGIGGQWTQPGKGGQNNVWLMSTDGTQAWPLTNIAGAGQIALGTMWARFNQTGTEIVWASMTTPSIGNLGYWELKVADITWTGGTPSLTNVRVIQPATNLFMEPYGFTPDGNGILFASSYGQPSWTDSQIFTINIDGTGLTQLTNDGGTNGPLFTNYHEFAFYMPGENKILYGSTVGAPDGGIDYWTMNDDGSDPQRLTYFNFPWSTESQGYIAVGAIVFDPSNPNHFLAGLAADPQAQTMNAESVTINPNPPAGLSEQFYAGTSTTFSQPIGTATTGDPSTAWAFTGSPAAGVPASSYSIRWSGSVTPPVSGTYQLCSTTELNDQVYINGQELINGTLSWGNRLCNTVSLTAGVPFNLVVAYEHGTGTGYGQLTWELPGTTTPVQIDRSLMSPQQVTIATTPGTPPATVASSTGSTTKTKPVKPKKPVSKATKTTKATKATAKAASASSATHTSKKAKPHAKLARKHSKHRHHHHHRHHHRRSRHHAH